MLGYLTCTGRKHIEGGLNLAFSNLLVTGGLHRCTRTARSGRVFPEVFYDVRTVLPIDELGPSKQAHWSRAASPPKW